MQPCERSDRVPEGQTSHTLYLAGIYRGGHDVLIRIQMSSGGALTNSGTTTIATQLTMRSTKKFAVQLVASAMANIIEQ